MPVSDSIDATKAVCLVMDYIVAYQMLTRSAKVQSGDTVCSRVSAVVWERRSCRLPAPRAPRARDRP